MCYSHPWVTTASFSVCCRNSQKSLFQFVSNHCNYLRIFFSSKLKLNSRHSLKLVLLWATRSECSVYKSRMCSQGLRKNCTFAQIWDGGLMGPGVTGALVWLAKFAQSCECSKTATRGETRGERRENTGPGWPRVLRHITMTHERPDPSPDPQLQNCSRHAPSRHPGPAHSNSHRRFEARIPDCSTGAIYRAALQHRVEWEPAEVLWTISGLCVSFAGCLRLRLQQTPSRVQPLHPGPAHLKLTSASRRAREWQTKNQICSKTTSTWIITQTSVISLVSPNLPWDRHI